MSPESCALLLDRSQGQQTPDPTKTPRARLVQEATDVAAVHAGYAKHRHDLLDAGVTLYELRRLAPGIWKDQQHFGMSSSSASSSTGGS